MNRKGFTLVELLAVIVVLGTLITFATVGTLSLIQRNKDKAVAENVANLKDGAVSYALSLNTYLSQCVSDTTVTYTNVADICGVNEYMAFDVATLINNGFFKDDRKNCHSEQDEEGLGIKVYREPDDSYHVLFSIDEAEVCQKNNQ